MDILTGKQFSRIIGAIMGYVLTVRREVQRVKHIIYGRARNMEHGILLLFNKN